MTSFTVVYLSLGSGQSCQAGLFLKDHPLLVWFLNAWFVRRRGKKKNLAKLE
ncbi:hypothetical protein [Methanothrix soehngenii]|uniref:hypothetical protein n=1 Tax=Methanothrix soehngenii TaxID=2223 RepID=UPI00300CD560